MRKIQPGRAFQLFFDPITGYFHRDLFPRYRPVADGDQIALSNFRDNSFLLAVLLVGSVAPVAQSREEAQLAVRIQQLEERIQVLTGQVEGLQFQLTQMQTMLEKQAEDETGFRSSSSRAAPRRPPRRRRVRTEPACRPTRRPPRRYRRSPRWRCPPTSSRWRARSANRSNPLLGSNPAMGALGD